MKGLEEGDVNDIWIVVPQAKKSFNDFTSDLQQIEVKISHPRSVNNKDEVVELVNKYRSGS